MRNAVFYFVVAICISIFTGFAICSFHIEAGNSENNKETKTVRFKAIGNISKKGMSLGNPVFSPDGKKITVSAKKEVYVFTINKSTLKQVGTYRGSVEGWTPDSRFLIIGKKFFDINFKKGIGKTTISSTSFDVLKQNRDGSCYAIERKVEEKIVRKDISQITDWLVAYKVVEKGKEENENGELWVKLKDWKREIAENVGRVHSIRTAPSGTRVFVDFHEGKRSKSIVYDKKTDSVYEMPKAENVDVGYSGTIGYSWSPDSERLIFCESADDGHVTLWSDIFIVSWKGDKKRRVTNDGEKFLEYYPVWGPDNKIAFMYEIPGLYVSPGKGCGGGYREASKDPYFKVRVGQLFFK